MSYICMYILYCYDDSKVLMRINVKKGDCDTYTDNFLSMYQIIL